MGMTVIVTRDVEDRYRGFLASCMLEIAPGVYTSPRMNPATRDRIWRVLEGWFIALQRGSIIMTWRAPEEPGGQGLLQLGQPPKQFQVVDGLALVRRQLPLESER